MMIKINPERLPSGWPAFSSRGRSQDEDALFRSLLNGDTRARREFEEAMYKRLLGLARKRLRESGFRRLRDRSIEKSKSIVHETWAKLLRAPELAKKPPEEFVRLCASNMLKLLIDLFREMKAHGKVLIPQRPVGGLTTTGQADIEDYPDRKDPFEKRDQKLDLDNAIDTLSEDLKTVVELHLVLGLSLKQVALVLHISYDTAKCRWREALKSLNKRLGLGWNHRSSPRDQ